MLSLIVKIYRFCLCSCERLNKITQLQDYSFIWLIVDCGWDVASFRSALMHARTVCIPAPIAGSRLPATTECKTPWRRKKLQPSSDKHTF